MIWTDVLPNGPSELCFLFQHIVVATGTLVPAQCQQTVFNVLQCSDLILTFPHSHNKNILSSMPRLNHTYNLSLSALSTSLHFHSQEAPASRSRRTVDESKTSCLLHFHVDHLYYQRYKSVEAVVAQVTRLYFWFWICGAQIRVHF